MEELRNELLSSQGNFNETVEQLTLQSKELASLKSEFLMTKQQQIQAEQQVSSFIS